MCAARHGRRVCETDCTWFDDVKTWMSNSITIVFVCTCVHTVHAYIMLADLFARPSKLPASREPLIYVAVCDSVSVCVWARKCICARDSELSDFTVSLFFISLRSHSLNDSWRKSRIEPYKLYWTFKSQLQHKMRIQILILEYTFNIPEISYCISYTLVFNIYKGFKYESDTNSDHRLIE